MNSTPSPSSRLTVTQWLIVGTASLGFAFDIYELLMMPLIATPALAELLGVPPDSPQIRQWVGWIFWGSALSGGAFGLLGGYLTDRFGRRRVLVWSILLYAGSACAAAFSTSAMMLLVMRCLTFVGVCVEFVAAVAWLAELFPNPRQRETVLGYTQAFSSIGGLMVTGANALAVAWAMHLPAIYGGHSAWRYTLLSGLLPAIPLLIVRPFLPESPVWAQRRQRGELHRPSFFELFKPGLRATTIVTAVLFACAYGAAFGALQLTPAQVVPGTPEVIAQQQRANELSQSRKALEVELEPLSAEMPRHAELSQEIARLAGEERAARSAVEQSRNLVQFFQEIGGLTGRLLLAFLTVRILSRRLLLRIFQVPGLILMPLVFWFAATESIELLKWGIFFIAVCTVGQFSFWGNYLPRVFPTHLRGTGEGFAANVGGRMIGTSAALITTQLAIIMPGEITFTKVAYAAGAVGLGVYAIGLIASFWLPEPEQALPD